jgi:hypothetical protein
MSNEEDVMKTKIHGDCKFLFILLSIMCAIVAGFFVIPLLNIYLTVHDRNMDTLSLTLVIVSICLFGTAASLLLTWLVSSRIGSGAYILGPGLDEGATITFTEPTWVPIKYYDQLLHISRSNDGKKSFVIFCIVTGVGVAAWVVILGVAFHREDVYLRAKYNIMNAPSQGRLSSISYPSPAHNLSGDKVYVRVDGSEWTASISQVLLVYDEGMQELFQCSQRIHQEYLYIRDPQPEVKIEKLGRLGSASGDNREVVKISLLEE